MKRFFSMLLVACLLVSLVPSTLADDVLVDESILLEEGDEFDPVIGESEDEDLFLELDDADLIGLDEDISEPESLPVEEDAASDMGYIRLNRDAQVYSDPDCLEALVVLPDESVVLRVEALDSALLIAFPEAAS
ncbi:MAG: hypothetical protein IKS52_09645 [Clostridia bacterium]|nr:hypothetical protein [Clostridia bacterium]